MGSKTQASAPDNALKAHAVTASAIAALLHPFAEVVLHDIRTGSIVGIWNAFSDRKVGDPSFLGTDFDESVQQDVNGPYEKASASGTRIKAVSATLRDVNGKRIGYLCINMDVARVDMAISILNMLSATPEPRPVRPFKYDIREQINLVIREFTIKRNKTLEALSRSERLELLAEIDERGYFEAKNSVPIVAQILNMGRTNLYHLIKNSRSKSPSAAPRATRPYRGRGRRPNPPSSASR